MLIVRRLLLVALAPVLLACGGGQEVPPADPAPSPEATATSTPAPGADGEPVVTLVGPDGEELAFRVEVAADPPTRQTGLMHRTELDDDAGMLFLFPQDTEGGFWMMNTLIPLDIAFIADDGVVVAVLQMEPCEEEPCPSYSPGAPYRSALEVNAGALVDAGVEAGWTAELPEDLPEAQ